MNNGVLVNRDPAAFYRRAILAETPRVLSLMDREPLSPTVGCGDRTYWAWKFVDFPGSRFQESLCVLSFLYATSFEGNRYHRQPRLLEWIDAGLRFWSRLQHADGSFDEAYPMERSLAATAFTTFYVGEALEFLGEALDRDTRALVRDTMTGAGAWLCRNDEHHGVLSNHLAAAAAALLHTSRVTGEAAFERRSRHFLQRILDHQSGEGWYEEYGGADPGYQTHGTFYLARYQQLTGDVALWESLTRSTHFLAHFVHPDGSLGGEYASRNTKTYYPAGFELLAGQDGSARWIAERMRPSLAASGVAALHCVDAYNYFPFLNNYVFAYGACVGSERPDHAPVDPTPDSGTVAFTEAGIVRVRTAVCEVVIGTKKGGVLKIYERAAARLVDSDCGYVGTLGGGRLCSTQWHAPDWHVTVEDGTIGVEGAFAVLSRPIMSPMRFVAFRLFSLTAGRLPALARWLKQYLVKVLIYRRRRLRLDFRRTIVVGEREVRVRDEIGGPDAGQVHALRRLAVFASVHMGSSRYFVENELWDGTAPDVVDTRADVSAAGIVRERTISVGPT